MRAWSTPFKRLIFCITSTMMSSSISEIFVMGYRHSFVISFIICPSTLRIMHTFLDLFPWGNNPWFHGFWLFHTSLLEKLLLHHCFLMPVISWSYIYETYLRYVLNHIHWTVKEFPTESRFLRVSTIVSLYKVLWAGFRHPHSSGVKSMNTSLKVNCAWEKAIPDSVSFFFLIFWAFSSGSMSLQRSILMFPRSTSSTKSQLLRTFLVMNLLLS